MRERLPTRRLSPGSAIEWKGEKYSVTIGYYPDGRAGEIFISHPKIGSELAMLLNDCATLISLLLQHGVDAVELYKSLGRHSDMILGEPSDQPSSIAGEMVHHILIMERRDGNGIAKLHKIACDGMSRTKEVG